MRSRTGHSRAGGNLESGRCRRSRLRGNDVVMVMGAYTNRKSVECIHAEAGVCQPSGTSLKLVVNREAS